MESHGFATYEAQLGTPDDRTAWFARGIFENGNITLLGDRQAWLEADEESKAETVAWLQKHAFEMARLKAQELFLRNELWGGASGVVALYEDEHGIIVGDCRKSYGYLYLGAWLKSDDEQLDDMELAANRRQPDAPYRDGER